MPPWERYQQAAQPSGPWTKYSAMKQPAAEAANPQSFGRTAFDQGMQGATFALADEPMDVLGAAIAKYLPEALGGRPDLFENQDYGEVLKDTRAATRDRLSSQFEQRPGTSIAANLAGGLATGILGAGTKAGAAVSNSLRSGGLGARVAKSAAAGAASGSAYGFGAADDGERGEGALRGGAVGGAFGAAAPAVGAAIGSAYQGTKNAIQGVTARSVDELDDAVGAIKQSSSQAYKAMREAGAVINRNRAVNIANRIESAVKKDSNLNPRLHATTIGLLDDFKEVARQGNMTLEDLDKWRQVFGQVAGNFNDTYNKRAASIAIDSIDDAVNRLSSIDIKGGNTAAVKALNLGRSEWAKARKFERIADIVKRSEGDANFLKRELKKIVNNKKLQRGFSQQELEAIEATSKMTASDAMLKTLGRFGFDAARLGTGVGAVAGSVAGGAFGGPTGAIMAPIVGTGARQLRKAITRGKAENILRTIEGVAKPAARSITRSTGIVPAVIEGQAAKGLTKEAPAIPAIDINTPGGLPEVELPTVGPQSSADFDSAVDFVLNIEGGYVPDDAGKGPSNLGINKSANPDVDIKNLTSAKAKGIYKKRYWDAIGADKLPPEMALVAFDASVNHGPNKAKALIRKAKGDPLKLIDLRKDEYIRLVKSNPKKYGEYLKGWFGRLESLRNELA